jgi:hypothetical protein
MGIGILIGVMIIPAIVGLFALVLTAIYAIPYYKAAIQFHFAKKKEAKFNKKEGE